MYLRQDRGDLISDLVKSLEFDCGFHSLPVKRSHRWDCSVVGWLHFCLWWFTPTVDNGLKQISRDHYHWLGLNIGEARDMSSNLIMFNDVMVCSNWVWVQLWLLSADARKVNHPVNNHLIHFMNTHTAVVVARNAFPATPCFSRGTVRAPLLHLTGVFSKYFQEFRARFFWSLVQSRSTGFSLLFCGSKHNT